MRLPLLLTAAFAFSLTAAASTQPLVDKHSYAQPDQVVTRHLSLDLAIDFAAKTLGGTATLDLAWRNSSTGVLTLDTRDLTITRTEAGDGTTWSDVPFQLAPADATLGSKLTIQTGGPVAQVRITYRTSPQASGLQWLEAAQTQGQRAPFMFSQSQQIHARSWVPLQDAPQIRFTYDARITSPADVMVLMSADNDPHAARDGDYHFTMPQPIPSYLLAIAAGDLVFQPITGRAGVWAEPEMAPKAAAEFVDTGKMIEVAEQLYGPYRWGRYDILVLPPSFPYGGMENPRLTFATPTIVTGDRSLVSVIAHELAHSWSGNLVTFAVSRDGWLNEGFTSYVENRIIDALYGQSQAYMENVIKRNQLKVDFTPDNLPQQILAPPTDSNPATEGPLTSTVYAKGAWFMQFLEQRFGRAEFDRFLRSYFDHFAFQAITTEQFADYAQANLLEKYPGKVTAGEFAEWLYQPGVPATAPQTFSARLMIVDTARAAWLATGTTPDPALTAIWTTYEWVHFLEGLPKTLSIAQLQALDAAAHFTGTPNGEIAQRWYPLTIRSGYTAARPAIAEFLKHIGRRKLIMPTYRALAATPDGLAFAREIFAQARPSMHPITIAGVEATLGSSPK